jgi:hypothetical protein
VRRFVVIATSVVAALCTAGILARAAPAEIGVDQCVEANTAAQSLRREGNLRAAREQLALCVATSCPALVRDDCTRRLDELDRAQPTIVFDARDGEGHDVTDVTIAVDGRAAQPLEGLALAIDPGAHTFTFEAPGRFPKVTHKLVLREGEKGRRERILLGRTASTIVAVAPGSSPTAPPLGPQRVASLVTFGVGLVGVGAGVALLVHAQSKANDADAYCPGPVCSNDAALQMNHDARVAGNLATVAFAAGALGIAGGVVLWLTAQPSPSSPSTEVALVGSTLRLRGTW